MDQYFGLIERKKKQVSTDYWCIIYRYLYFVLEFMIGLWRIDLIWTSGLLIKSLHVGWIFFYWKEPFLPIWLSDQYFGIIKQKERETMISDAYHAAGVRKRQIQIQNYFLWIKKIVNLVNILFGITMRNAFMVSFFF